LLYGVNELVTEWDTTRIWNKSDCSAEAPHAHAHQHKPFSVLGPGPLCDYDWEYQNLVDGWHWLCGL